MSALTLGIIVKFDDQIGHRKCKNILPMDPYRMRILIVRAPNLLDESYCRLFWDYMGEDICGTEARAIYEIFCFAWLFSLLLCFNVQKLTIGDMTAILDYFATVEWV